MQLPWGQASEGMMGPSGVGHLGEPGFPYQVPMTPESCLWVGHEHCNLSVSVELELPRQQPVSGQGLLSSS